MRSKPHPYMEAISRQSRFPNDYWSALKRLLVWGSNNYSFRLRTNSSSYIKLLLNRAQATIAVALPLYHDFTHRPIVKQHPAGKTEVVHTIIPLRSDTQALRLIASIPLIQRRDKCHSHEEKSVFPQWYSYIYARSLKDQARKSQYPRTQILEPRTQPKLIGHSSATFIHTRTNNLLL